MKKQLPQAAVMVSILDRRIEDLRDIFADVIEMLSEIDCENDYKAYTAYASFRDTLGDMIDDLDEAANQLIVELSA